ncbi:hypothetical protein HOLleu_15763 [Holothuria leucospilota]|uniref:Uncharacterized protein n=1 Tax=Holothuria leucospilota TaxID=206669 RepID=A0A9Q1C4M7_HOLLE|nr:hypothetical protein HOLleu_15763 [Holothuria leucospilota]
MRREQARKDPGQTEASRALKMLNKQVLSRLALQFRNVHGLCKKGRPYTDYTLLCDLDEAKGMDIGKQYRTDKKAAEFATSIAEAERERMRKDFSTAKFIAAISDGTTDSSFQETEIVYVRHCQAGKNQSELFSS